MQGALLAKATWLEGRQRLLSVSLIHPSQMDPTIPAFRDLGALL